MSRISESYREFPLVAIDGPAGAGKSTISKLLADKLGYTLLDTGALYRCVGLAALRAEALQRPDLAGEIAEDLAEKDAIQFVHSTIDGKPSVKIMMGDEDVSATIRTLAVADAASRVSAVPMVRQALLQMQRNFGKDGRVVVEGRDIGSVVFPDAEVKFFLTASSHARANRRFEELVGKGIPTSLDEVHREVVERDRRDSERPIAPLMQAEDAVVVDSTGIGIEDVLHMMVRTVRDVESALSNKREGK